MSKIDHSRSKSQRRKEQNFFFVIISLPIFLLIMILSPLQFSVGLAAENVKSADLSTAIVEVARQNIPAVVAIEVTESREVTNPFLPFEQDPFFRRFFNVPKMPPKFKQEMRGLGSGMIIDTQGHILTNYHVAGGATKMEVVLADGNRYPGKLIGGDPKTDLAVIKISSKETLPHVKFADSDKLEVGEWVVAIGAPRALEKTVTQGSSVPSIGGASAIQAVIRIFYKQMQRSIPGTAVAPCLTCKERWWG